ncbi:MAG: hypothetical protein QOG79_8017 [Mycobacterium sp.]|jgi:hypothetical protein|nr:hypothetical protein [Mycobacterium sp.]MDT5318593.1 hypothetical protein [Mycobacterium sp.]
MTPPRVAVLGSCVSRDCFNRLLVPDYRHYATVVDSAFQTAFPSLVRRGTMKVAPPALRALRPRHQRPLTEDFGGASFDRFLRIRPDVVVVDLYADVHFGCVEHAGRFVTRNHMAFASLAEADSFFNDHGLQPAGRLRPTPTPYDQTFVQALQQFAVCVRRDAPHTLIVLNQARRASHYRLSAGTTAAFDHPDHIEAHNAAWCRADALFLDVVADAQTLNYPPEIFLGSVSHPWGLHPVHYTDGFYRAFWRQLNQLLDSRCR